MHLWLTSVRLLKNVSPLMIRPLPHIQVPVQESSKDITTQDLVTPFMEPFGKRCASYP